MPVELFEQLPGVDVEGGPDGVIELAYIARGGEGDTWEDVTAAFQSDTLATRWGLVREDQPAIVETFTGGGQSWWKCTLRYVPPEMSTSNAPGRNNLSFAISYETKHIERSLATTIYYRPGAQRPDHVGLIEVHNGECAGLDIITPTYVEEESHILASTHVSNAWRRAVRDLVGCTNKNPWRGHAADECLFLGAVGGGSGRPNALWEVVFAWACGKHLAELTIAEINSIYKKAWDHLWIKKDTVPDEAAKVLALRPRYVFTEQVYRQGDFAVLGLPGI